MRLGNLTVVHLPKNRKSELNGAALDGAFFLDSCQRRLWVFNSDIQPVCDGAEVYSGSEAYQFLLLVATGLKSEIQGETNIFGQIKEAWQQFSEGGSECARDLGPWMQRLFEDTKEIRSRHLQGFGGDAYGSLVRKFLGKSLEGPILVVGAGQISQSVAPWLAVQDLWLVNRNPERREALARELAARPGVRVRSVDCADEADAWRKARHAVVCVPLDDERDPMRVACWKEGHGGGGSRAIIHLGVNGAERGHWAGLPDFFALDDLFAYQKAQGDVRSAAVAQAMRACDERAKLRSLGTSVTLPHGWEDLAVFV